MAPAPHRLPHRGPGDRRLTRGCVPGARRGRPGCVLKREPADDPFGELQDEVARLRWLQGQGVEAAQVLDTHDDASGRWLLMGAVPGRDLASSPDLAPLQVVHLVADALQMLHRLPIDDCPFDHLGEQWVAPFFARYGTVPDPAALAFYCLLDEFF
ncbi:phosphotransferase [Stenotrophomonas rhizophila]